MDRTKRDKIANLANRRAVEEFPPSEFNDEREHIIDKRQISKDLDSLKNYEADKNDLRLQEILSGFQSEPKVITRSKKDLHKNVRQLKLVLVNDYSRSFLILPLFYLFFALVFKIS